MNPENSKTKTSPCRAAASFNSPVEPTVLSTRIFTCDLSSIAPCFDRVSSHPTGLGALGTLSLLDRVNSLLRQTKCIRRWRPIALRGDVLVFEFSGFIVAGSSSVCHPPKSARPRFSRIGLLSTAQPAVPMNTESKNGDY